MFVFNKKKNLQDFHSALKGDFVDFLVALPQSTNKSFVTAIFNFRWIDMVLLK